MKNMMKHYGTTVRGLALLMLSANMAQADESHWVPGSACEAMDGAYASQVALTTAVANKSTTNSLRVTCPLFVNNSFSSSYDFMDVEIVATKKTNESMTCAVENRNWENTGGTISQRTFQGEGVKIFVFASIPVYPSLYSVHAIRCSIPKAGGTSAATRTTLNAYNFYEYN